MKDNEIKKAIQGLQDAVNDLDGKGISLTISFGDEEIKLEPDSKTLL